MASQLGVKVIPAGGHKPQAQQRLYARLRYARQLPNLDSAERAPKPLEVQSSVGVELDAGGAAAFVVDDRAAGTPLSLQIETGQGAVLWQADGTAADADSGEVEFKVPQEVYKAAGPAATPTPVPLLVRIGRFTRFDDQLPRFDGHRLFVAPVRPDPLPEGGSNAQTAAARVLLGLGGAGELTDFEVMMVDAQKADAATANALGFRDASIRADGSFDMSLEIQGDEVGWVWLLLGPVTYAGYQVDRSPTHPRKNVVIILPTVEAPPGGEGAGGAGGGLPEPASGGSTVPPMDFDERQLVENPAEFGDDPGRYCSPFENPQRILGERRFFTVLRVDQPQLGGEGSLRISRPIVLDLAPPVRTSVLAAEFLPQPDVGSAVRPTLATELSRSIRIAATAAGGAERSIAARDVLNAQVMSPISQRWRRWIVDRSRQRAPVSPTNPIEWEGDPTIYQAGSVAGGHVLEWRVQWRSNGYSLGDVEHTLTLAPRQTRRISRISWRRREIASRREATQVRDQVVQTTARDRDYNDAVQSSLSEWSKGGSESSTTGAAGGIGFALGPVVIGGGAAHGQASSSSWQSGGRRVAASEQQSLRDAIRQFGESLRRLESTVLTEVSQEEDVEGVSETLRNVNYCHALTVVYHEILRHYRVDTGFAGVRECLFVPFSVTPFDVDKALKWRDKLRGGMLARDLRWALDRLDEVATAWVDSDIPPGRRSSHPINYATGSAYVRLSVERPRDREEEETIEQHRQVWTRLAPLLGLPVNRIIAQMERENVDRDTYFQREVAPTIAAKWADRLRLSVGGNTVDGADFTLASSYRFGGTVRIDFTIPVGRQFSREDLQQMVLRSVDSLPQGSVANLTRLSLNYYTDHFDSTAESVRSENDLVKSDTGDADAQGASVLMPLTQWELQDLRRVIEDAVDKLIVHLNANLVYYHKVIWWLMDRDELYMLLDGFTAPYGRRFENGAWVEDTGRSLASVVEREPMGILGNSLVFQVASGAFLGIDGHESPAALHDYYFDSEFRSQPLRVSLPTEGLYAQALMDRCNACEEHYGGTDWVLADNEPELEALADLLGTRRAAPEGMTPTELPGTIISLQNAPAAPDPTGLGAILQAVTSSESFRDMAGLAGTQANAMGALTQAAALAQGFGQMAVDFQKSKQATGMAKQKLDNIKKAQSDGLVDQAEASKQAARALDEQNMTPQAPHLTQDEPIKSALNNAATTGRSIEASRQTKDGFEAIKVAGSGEDSGRSFIIEDAGLDADRRAFGPRRLDKSGQAVLQVRVPRLPAGGSVRWSVPPGEAGHYTFAGGATTQAGMRAEITALRPGLSSVDVEVRDAAGAVIESQKLPLSIPQFVAVDVGAATFTPLMTGFGLLDAEIEEILRSAKETCDASLNTANVRSIWRMPPFGEALPAQLAPGGAGAGLVTQATFQGDPPSHALYGQTLRGTGAIGPASFDELIDVFAGAFDDAVAGNANAEVDEATNEIVATIVAFGGQSSSEKALAFVVFGRVLGETLAHEIVHSLIGATLGDGFHNAHPGFGNDLMNHGIDRSFESRSGFEVTAPLGSGTIDVVLRDRGAVFVNIITGDAQAQVNQSFPIPGPAFQ
jgi:hypothetical protein